MDAGQETATTTETTQATEAAAQVANEGQQAGTEAEAKPIDFKALVAERLGKPGAKAAESQAEKPATEDKPADKLQDKSKDKPAEAEKKEEPAAKPEDDPVKRELEERLSRLNEASRRAAEARKVKQSEAEAAKKLKAAESAHAEEIALAKQLREAKGKGDVLGVLRAAGWTKQEIESTPMIANLLEQLEKAEDDAPPKPLTEADIERKLQEREAAREAEAKAKADEEKARLKQQAEEERDRYFVGVKVEFKAGNYPALRSAGTTMGQLEQYRANYMAKNPNHAPTAKELLDMAERDIVAFWEKNAAELAKIRGTATTAATAAAKPGEKQPEAKPAKRTVSSKMQTDTGATVAKEEPAPKKAYRDKEKEMRDSFVARFAK